MVTEIRAASNGVNLASTNVSKATFSVLRKTSGLSKVVVRPEKLVFPDVTEHPQLLMEAPTGPPTSMPIPLVVSLSSHLYYAAAIHPLHVRRACAPWRGAAMDGSKNTIHGLQFWLLP